jgi:hypothetical protein
MCIDITVTMVILRDCGPCRIIFMTTCLCYFRFPVIIDGKLNFLKHILKFCSVLHSHTRGQAHVILYHEKRTCLVTSRWINFARRHSQYQTWSACHMSLAVFRVVTPCGLIGGYRRFGGNPVGCSRHLLQHRKPQISVYIVIFWVVAHCNVSYVYQRFSPGDGGSMFLQNVGINPRNITAQQSRRPYVSSCR